MTDSHKKPKQELEIEEAIVFLVNRVNRIQESGNNPKPVILHSMRVGVYLFNHHYEPHIVKAGFLHDVIEDSATFARWRSKEGEINNFPIWGPRHLPMILKLYQLAIRIG